MQELVKDGGLDEQSTRAQTHLALIQETRPVQHQGLIHVHNYVNVAYIVI